jgi:hypothetical protein
MAGQQSLKKYDREHLYNQYKKSLKKQVDLWYIEDKFAIKTDFNENKALSSYLLSEAYSAKNCETIKFIERKIRGALGDEEVKIVDLESLQTTYGDTYNYYYSAANYEKVEW